MPLDVWGGPPTVKKNRRTRFSGGVAMSWNDDPRKRFQVTAPSESTALPKTNSTIEPPQETPPKSGETVRETIIRSIREVETAMAKPAPPSIDVQALADKAVLALCELLALLFGLPFGEALYNDKPFTAWHTFYLGVAILFAVTGPFWPWIRTITWLPEKISASLSRAALDARIWIAALLMLFAYSAAPELYRRATQSSSPPAFTQGKLWPPLTDKEELSLEQALKGIKVRPIRIICISANCRELAGNLIGAFHNAGWDVFGAFSGFPQEPVGIRVFLRDIQDKSLSAAIEKATSLKVEATEASNDPTFDSIFIGIKP
jgi:hypothetical protein